MSDSVLLTVGGLVISALVAVGHLYSMVFDIRKQVKEDMDERMTEFNRQIGDVRKQIGDVGLMLQSDRQLREENRVLTERELGRTVKHDDLQRAMDRLLGEIRDVKNIASGPGFHSPQRSTRN